MSSPSFPSYLSSGISLRTEIPCLTPPLPFPNFVHLLVFIFLYHSSHHLTLDPQVCVIVYFQSFSLECNPQEGRLFLWITAISQHPEYATVDARRSMTFIYISEMNKSVKLALSDCRPLSLSGLPWGETRFSLKDTGLASSLY